MAIHIVARWFTTYNKQSVIFFSQLTQTSPPEFMSSTLQELGIGTYQNVAMVSEYWSCFSVIIFLIVYIPFLRPRMHVSRHQEKPQNRNWEQVTYFRARNNGRSTDNVRTDLGVDRSSFCLAGHVDRSHLIVLKMK